MSFVPAVLRQKIIKVFHSVADEPNRIRIRSDPKFSHYLYINAFTFVKKLFLEMQVFFSTNFKVSLHVITDKIYFSNMTVQVLLLKILYRILSDLD